MIHDIANTLRSLSIDMIEEASSGHIGLPMGMSDVCAVLFTEFFKKEDNFVLSAGHGSALLYSILYMRGIINDLHGFRRGNKLPGHPEYGIGVDSTTGPLGQGVASAVGMAICKEKTYVLAGDGCLMEGISLEAIAIAGHLKLNNLILLWDDNKYTIDGHVSKTRSENVCDIFKANNWHTINSNGHDYNKIRNSFNSCSNTKPTMIAFSTIIGKYTPYENSEKAHAKIMNSNEIVATKNKINMRSTEKFKVDKKIYDSFPKIKAKERHIAKITLQKPKNIKMDNRSTREYVNDVRNMLSNENIIYGSADLDNSTYIKSDICYGTREHAMFGIMNGISIAGKLPISSTFLSFLDYGRAAIRIAALSKLRTITFATHDSILLGEDGPTHQPIEHLMSYRIIPNVLLFRPYDLNEMIISMEIALKHNGPSIFALSRQKVKREIEGKQNKNGVYIISDSSNSILDIWASGSEVSVAYELKKMFEKDNIPTRIISAYCLNLYNKKIPSSKYSVSIEFGSSFGWKEFHNGISIGINEFGTSNSMENILKIFKLRAVDIYEKLKFTYLKELY